MFELERSVQLKWSRFPRCFIVMASTLTLLSSYGVSNSALAQTGSDPPINTDNPLIQPGSPADNSPPEEIVPDIVTLALSPSISAEMEVIQWPDGQRSLPVRAFSALFGFEVQQSDLDGRLFFVDPQTGKRVEIYWLQQRITVNEEERPTGTKPVTRSQKGFLVADDVYIEQSAFESLFNVTVTMDPGTASMTLSTSRKLKLPISDQTGTAADDTPNIRLVKNPKISHALIDRASVHHSSNYGLQESFQPISASVRRTNFNALTDTSTVGVSGSLLGLEYAIKPSFTRFNNKFNLQNLDWNFQKKIKGSIASLGSSEVGLSPLTSPALRVWGLKLASSNATTPFLSPSSSYEYSGKAQTGNQVSLRLNQRTVQTVTAQDDHYDLEPVYLQGQSVNEVELVETDTQNHETVLMKRKIGYFPNMLPEGETGYSAFLGRTPIQFYPVLPDQNTPMLMPQTEKWLAGGRAFYGINNRLTVGLATAADQNFGRAETYFTNLDPLAIDLTGFSSYQRDPNFFSGQNLSASLRYQLTDNWLVSTDLGVGRYNLQPGSRLPIDRSGFGKAGKVHLETQGRLFSWYIDAFHYDPEYYTPANTLYGNTLYDKRGVSSGISGSFSRRLPTQYNFNWSRYQTNLQEMIPGGIILANHWQGSLNTQLSEKNILTLGYSLIHGDNNRRELAQRNLSATFRTQSLPWRLQGEVRASHYYSNTVFLPSPEFGTNLSEFDYQNNSLDTSLDIPFDKARNQRLQVGHRWSSFVNYGSLKGSFQYKRVFLEPFIQLSYGDKPQQQNRYGLRLGYQFKSGSRLSVAYYKVSSSFQGSALGGSSNSRIETDQFYFDFSDVFGLLANRLTSLGPNAETQGIIKGTVFADSKVDGQYNPKEPGVKNIRILVDRDNVITTDRQGRYSVTTLSPGYHTLEILPETLPLTLSADNPIYKIKVSEGKTHLVNIPLLPEGGLLSGQVELVDAKGDKINPKQMILVLINEAGNDVKYTMVNEQGEYRFSNISAGHYVIDLESKLKKSGRYKTLSAPRSVDLPIPKDYESVTEITRLDFRVMRL